MRYSLLLLVLKIIYWLICLRVSQGAAGVRGPQGYPGLPGPKVGCVQIMKMCFFTLFLVILGTSSKLNKKYSRNIHLLSGQDFSYQIWLWKHCITSICTFLDIKLNNFMYVFISGKSRQTRTWRREGWRGWRGFLFTCLVYHVVHRKRCTS